MEQDKTLSDNQIKIGASTRVRNVITYTLSLFKENKFSNVNISAIGGSIGSLINVVEVIKADVPGLHQVNKLSTVSYQTIDPNENIIQERLYPKMEIVLSIEEPKSKTEGYQKPISEDERKALSDFLLSAKEKRTENFNVRGGFRGRGNRDFRGRGGRGISSRGRGGFRGFDDSRGGRGFQPRGRGGFRGSNEDVRGGRGFQPRGRGGFRGLEDSRVGFQPRGRGGFRGSDESRRGFQPRGRGGFRGERGFQQRGRGVFRGERVFQPRGRGGFRGNDY